MVVVFDVRKRERVVKVIKRKCSGCEKRRRRTCVTGEGAENGLQRTVKLSSRSKAIKQNLWLSSEEDQRWLNQSSIAEMVSKLYQNKQIGLRKIFIQETRVVGWC
jgi:hypothetical protein